MCECLQLLNQLLFIIMIIQYQLSQSLFTLLISIFLQIVLENINQLLFHTFKLIIFQLEILIYFIKEVFYDVM